MSQIKSVNIPKPCHETWQAMTPVSDGRYCQSCCKTVMDFTQMSNNEIISYLSSNTNICGRFNNGQMSNINDHLQLDDAPIMPNLKGWSLLLALLVPVVFNRVLAQSKPVTVQASTNKSNHCNDTTIGKIVSPKYQTIKGAIVDDKNLPLAGAVVTVPQLNLSSVADVNGRFKLSVPMTATVFDVRFIGYDTQKVAIKTNGEQNYTIQLKPSQVLLGELVVITRPSFLKRVYYRFVKRPYRVLKNKLADF